MSNLPFPIRPSLRSVKGGQKFSWAIFVLVSSSRHNDEHSSRVTVPVATREGWCLCQYGAFPSPPLQLPPPPFTQDSSRRAPIRSSCCPLPRPPPPPPCRHNNSQTIVHRGVRGNLFFPPLPFLWQAAAEGAYSVYIWRCRCIDLGKIDRVIAPNSDTIYARCICLKSRSVFWGQFRGLSTRAKVVTTHWALEWGGGGGGRG